MLNKILQKERNRRLEYFLNVSFIYTLCQKDDFAVVTVV